MFELVKFNPWLVGLNLLMWFIAYSMVHQALDTPYYLTKYKKRAAFCILLLFCVYSFWGSDLFHVYDAYHELVQNNWHLESTYHWIAANLAPNSYFLWRLIVWGLASILLWGTFSSLNINKNLAIAIFLSAWMIWFSYARASLSMALAFYGFALIHSTKRWVKFGKLLGGAFILGSFYFHKSASFVIVCCLIVTIFPFFKKKAWWLPLILLLPLLYYLQQQLPSILLGNLETDSEEITSYIERGQGYMEASKKIQGIGYTLGQLLERIPYYMVAITSFRIITSDYADKLPKDIIAFMKVLVLITFTASIFMFNLSFNTQVIYERFMRFSFIPTCVILTYCLEYKIFHKWHRYALWIAIMGSAYQLTYILYCSIVLR